MIETKKITRGINDDFALKIKRDKFFQSIYNNGNGDIILAVRNNYVNLYYNCDSIALIKNNLSCKVDDFYLTGKGNEPDVFRSTQEIYTLLNTIKKNSNNRATTEKKVQQKLFMLNNGNPKSNWFCIDIEYQKAYRTIDERKQANFSGRFDIIAVSRAKPFRIAIIELKYGKRAYTGVSGIRKHIVDFDKLKNSGVFNDDFKTEMVEIINGLKSLGVAVPAEYGSISIQDFENAPEFYFITLDNNAKKKGASTPRQTCAGYLFSTKKWGCRRISRDNIEQEYGDITDPKNVRLFVKFLFSKQTLDHLTITDIIDGQYDEVNDERKNP